MANCKKCGRPVVTAPVYCPECQEGDDMVPVVRCKDCKWFYDGYDMRCCTKHTGLALIKPDGSSFCSYGERRAADG